MRGKGLARGRMEEQTMLRLEERFYSLDELAEAIDRKRDDHFARNAKNDLSYWGYQYTWHNRRGVTITKCSTDAFIRLAELMNRLFGLNRQISVYGFACFIYLMLADDTYACMPWGERAHALWEQFDIGVDDRTLRNWASTLLENDQLHKETTERQYWRTSKYDGYTFREPISLDDPDYIQYKSRQKELIEEYMGLGLTKSKAWSEAFKQLWREFECCYYSCPRFTFNMIAEDIQELIELASAVCAGA